MNKREFIGKKLNLVRLQNCSDNFSFPEEDLGEGEEPYYENGEFTKAEIFLQDFVNDDCYDVHGYNFYSIKIIVDGDKVIKLQKIAHCHECNNEGSDDELSRFPYKSLEKEATDYMNHCIKN